MQIHAARISVCLVVVGLFTMCVPTSQAALYEFYNITNNNAGNAAIGEEQLTVDVTSFGANQARFEFRNAGPEASSITGVLR